MAIPPKLPFTRFLRLLPMKHKNLRPSFAANATTEFRATREMARSRTLELAFNAGRKAHEIRQIDYEQATRELTGESNFERQQAFFDATTPSIESTTTNPSRS